MESGSAGEEREGEKKSHHLKMGQVNGSQFKFQMKLKSSVDDMKWAGDKLIWFSRAE